MPQFWDSLNPSLTGWALSQPLFFVSSAPTNGKHINLSPKGLPSTTFTIFSPTQCGYIDATGSGAETISHLYENGRATIMFCSFGPSPRIMRLFCTGRVVEWDSPEFETYLAKMGKKRIDGARAILLFEIWKVQSSCGYGVPKINLDFQPPTTLSSGKKEGDTEKALQTAFLDRETLGHWASQKVEKNELGAYQVKNNLFSLDGLPGLKSARRDAGQNLLLVDLQAFARRVAAQREALVVGVLMGFLVCFFGLWIRG